MLKAYLKIQALFLVMMTAHRLAFVSAYSEPTFWSQNLSDFVAAFLLGLRFDSSILIYANSLPLLLFLIARHFSGFYNSNWWPRFAVGFWTLTLVILQVAGVFDFYYYKHFQDRFNVVMIGFFTDDTRALISTIWKNYPIGWGALGFLITGVLGHRLFTIWVRQGMESSRSHSLKGKRAVAQSVLIVLVSALIGRGSLTFYPLGLIHTQISTEPFINLSTVNAPFRIKTAVKQYFKAKNFIFGNVKRFGYLGQMNQAMADVQGVFEVKQATNLGMALTRSSRNLLAQSAHVVLFIMESQGSDWLRFTQPDFDLVGGLSEELKHAAWTLKSIPGAIGTIGSLSSILSGVPHGTDSAILSESRYQNIEMPTSPALYFKKLGYKTRFVYGGNLGWRNIGAFARRQGFDSTDGEVEIERALGTSILEKHDWGIFDHDVFRYVSETLKQSSQPEFIVVMTTSNHPPFDLPKAFQRPNLTIPDELKRDLLVENDVASARFLATRYSHDALADTLKGLYSQSVGDRLIVAMTGDHGFWFRKLPEDQLLQKYAVPLAFWLPRTERGVRLREVLQKRLDSGFPGHLHMLSTVMDLVGSPVKSNPVQFLSFVPSLFADADVIGFSSQDFAMFPEVMVRLSGTNGVSFCYPAVKSASSLEVIPCSGAYEARIKQYQAFMSTIDLFLEELRSR